MSAPGHRIDSLGRRKESPTEMGSSKRLAPLYERYAQHREILAAAHRGPLQSLTDRELALNEYPLTIYPRPYCAVRAWKYQRE